MKRKGLLLSTVAVLCVSLLTIGCSTNKKVEDQVEEKNKEYVGPIKNSFETVPESLEDVKDKAEDIIDDVSEQDWASANEELTKLERNWENYKVISKEVNLSKDQIDEFNTDLNNLKKFIQEKKQYESSLTANKLTLYATNLYELYNPEVPVAVYRLEYYARQVMLTSENNDWEQANVDTQSAMNNWNKLKPQVDKINPDHSRIISDTITRLSDAIKKQDSAISREYSVKLLDEVDDLDDDFKRY
ncbi:MAG: DUF4363 family protein [Clostridiales bacterium]|nr:DUF4363 family protein [Clostridiales bacterium]